MLTLTRFSLNLDCLLCKVLYTSIKQDGNIFYYAMIPHHFSVMVCGVTVPFACVVFWNSFCSPPAITITVHTCTLLMRVLKQSTLLKLLKHCWTVYCLMFLPFGLTVLSYLYCTNNMCAFGYVEFC